MQCILNVMQVQLHLVTSWGPHLQLFNGVLDCQVGLSLSGPLSVLVSLLAWLDLSQ